MKAEMTSGPVAGAFGTFVTACRDGRGRRPVSPARRERRTRRGRRRHPGPGPPAGSSGSTRAAAAGSPPLPRLFPADPLPPRFPVVPRWPLLLGQGNRCAGLAKLIGPVWGSRPLSGPGPATPEPPDVAQAEGEPPEPPEGPAIGQGDLLKPPAGLLAAGPRYPHVDQFQIQALGGQVPAGAEAQEVVEVGGEPEGFGVMVEAPPGPGADQGGLVGRGGPQEQAEAEGPAAGEGGAPSQPRGPVRPLARIAAAADHQIRRLNPAGPPLRRLHGLLEHGAGGRPVVTAPEQQPVLRGRFPEALVHGPEDAGERRILGLPAEAVVPVAEGLQPGPVLRSAGPVDEQHLPVGPALALQGVHQPRQQLVGIEGGNDQAEPGGGAVGRRGAGGGAGWRCGAHPCRRISTSPSTSRSMRVRRKQSRAWAGVQTIGSFSLNEVLSTIGTPVRSAKARIRR